MATKNLVRSMIEGGRTSHNRRSRRLSHGPARANVGSVSAALGSGADAHFTIYPARKLVWRRFNEWLGPAECWLASQVGRRRSHFVIDCFGILRKVKRR